ncbi:hypothetical protein EDC50_1782 [Vulcaniibacterium tengchongense]|uniref:Uncharacterized protein n=1 Tax=Vulcaniibacterium tengchongense TaxID=1273429 RepID=A0A3N4VAD8_9GAMM|nr:hypothetical protein EDC50_1782 [Vulcaniibacterium tengchongense]
MLANLRRFLRRLARQLEGRWRDCDASGRSIGELG